ncbi:MAG: radical SAM protein [Nanoarchaeota archaeon]
MIKKVKRFIRPQLRTLIFFVTTKCPLRCKHCFYNDELNKDIRELNLVEIKKISNNLPHLEYLQLSGGEPFLRGDLVEILEIFFKKGLKKAIIPTNGYFTENTVSMVKKMKQKRFNFQIMISIDGFRELHNEIRGRDCFDRALETFDELKKLGVNVGFNPSLSKLNYNTYIDLLKFLKERTNSIDPILVRGKKGITLSAEEFKKIKSEVENITSRGLSPFYKKRQQMLNEIYCDILGGNKVPYKCLAGEIIAVLEPDGGVRSCEIRKKLGNARDYNYDINKILKMDKIPFRCSNCIHPCFIGPSMSYSPKWLLKNILFQYA